MGTLTLNLTIEFELGISCVFLLWRLETLIDLFPSNRSTNIALVYWYAQWWLLFFLCVTIVFNICADLAGERAFHVGRKVFSQTDLSDYDISFENIHENWCCARSRRMVSFDQIEISNHLRHDDERSYRERPSINQTKHPRSLTMKHDHLQA